MSNNNARIMIVDDMVTMRKLIINICGEIGYTDIIEAGDGTQAWDLIQNSSPSVSLVISDLTMQKGSGIDLIKRIRSDSRFQSLPFLIMITEGEKDQLGLAVKSGVDHYITKPFTAPVLKAKLQEIYEKRGG